MADPIDPDDLLDASEVAAVLGLARRQAVSTYRSRYPDFPTPRVSKNSGLCDLWLRADIERWADRRVHDRRLEADPAYGQGFEVGLGGSDASANPYPNPTEEHHSWNQGWQRGSALVGVDVEAMASEIERGGATARS